MSKRILDVRTGFGLAFTLLLGPVLATAAVRPAVAQDRLLTIATDYSTATLATLSISAPFAPSCDLTPVCGDAVVRWAGGLLYVVNRYGCDNVQVVDPGTWTTRNEFSVGGQTNPQDIAVLSPTRAYVSRYETNDLLEVNPTTGAVLGTISLAAFADADGLCEMHRLHVRGNRLFVQVQRMLRRDWPEPWIPATPSQLVVIDLNTRQIVDADPTVPGTQGIALAGTNPIAPIQVELATGDLLVPEAGQYGVIDAAGIERVDPVGLRSRGFLVTEAALEGDLVDFAQWSTARAYAIVSLPGYETALTAFDPTHGQSLGVVYNPGSYTLADLVTYPTGYLFVSDRDYFNPGIRVYQAATGVAAAGPVFTCLPPNELVVLPGATSGTGDPLGALQLGRPYPNPSRGPVHVGWTSEQLTRPTRLEVFDAYGRAVHARELGIDPGGADIDWDGEDTAGRPVPAGVYFLRVWAGERAAGVRTVRILR